MGQVPVDRNMLGAPLLLGSICGLVIAFVGTIAVAGRILGEEQMLVDELEGYKDHT
jgi:protein-S-isoprenylcysteine O-methyltransferase Ste14